MTLDPRFGPEREALELLPWYVNGTLADPEREQVRLALRSSLTCRLEYERLNRLQAVMQSDDAEHAAADRGFEALMARIRASDGRRTAAMASPRWGLRLAEAAAVLAIVSGIAWWALDRAAPRPGTYETLTTERPAASGSPQVRLEFARGVPEAARAAVLAPFGLRIDAPPTPDGIYTIALPPGADARALVERLRADPRIAFVATPEPGAP